MKTALLLIAHGSRHADANEDLFVAAAEMRRRGGFDVVEAAFLELAEPRIVDGAAACVMQGANRVVMLPYFLSPGVHVCRDLHELRDELAERYEDVEFSVAQPLGRHPRLWDVLEARASEALANHNGIANTSSASST